MAQDEESSQIPFRLLVPQAFVSFMDSLSYMVTAPSLIFYVTGQGGSYEAYGIIMSIFSFSSFCFKPVLGYWCDKSGGKFRAPYLSTLAISSLGGLVYFCASLCPPGYFAIGMILAGRFLGGMGAANQTLGFTYIAQVIDRKVLTQASALLSMTRIAGLAIAPALNIFLGMINTTIYIGSYPLKLTPLNSVGLFLFFGNLSTFAIIYYRLEEPPPMKKQASNENGEIVDEGSPKFWKSVFCIEILVPILAVFTMNVNFQLADTGMAPVANDTLGWGPVGISTLFGFTAVLMLAAILTTIQLSRAHVKDESLLALGCVFSIVGYTMMYLFWKKPTTPFLFAMPLVLSVLAFPFMSSPNRSLFTMIVDSKPYLRNNQGTMQALLSMTASIAGFVAPSLISVFILRKPEEVAASRDGREFGPFALFAPTMSFLTLLGVWMAFFIKKPLDQPLDDDKVEEDGGSIADETSGLVPKQQKKCSWSRESFKSPDFTPRTQALRRDTCTMMGIPVIFHDYEFVNRRPAHRQSTGTMLKSESIRQAEEGSRRVSNWF